MKKTVITLKDSSGGLNNSDPASKLKVNEFAESQNVNTDEGAYYQKRKGKQVIGEMINPVTGTVDANHKSMWHFEDTTGGPFLDETANNIDLSSFRTDYPVSVAGVFTQGISFKPPDGEPSPIYYRASAPLDDLSAVTFDTWGIIDVAFNGLPQSYSFFRCDGNQTARVNTGACIVGTATLGNDKNTVGSVVNGLTIHSDRIGVIKSSEPYIKFTLKTKGVVGTTTILTSGHLQVGVKLHLRGHYDSITGKMELYVNGLLHAEAIATGGGLVDDSTAECYAVGGSIDRAADLSLVGPTSGNQWNTVFATAISGNTLFAGGNFSSFYGEPRNNIVAFNLVSGAVTNWAASEAPGVIYAMTVYGTTLYVGGVGGVWAYDITTGQLLWKGTTGVNNVWSLVCDGTNLYIGGAFASYTDSALTVSVRNYCCAVTVSNGVITPFDPNLNSHVFALALTGSSLYLGGAFTTAGGQGRNYACMFDTGTGLIDGTWNPDVDSYVYVLAISGSVVYMGGIFTTVNTGTARLKVCAVGIADGLVTAWNPAVTGSYVKYLLSTTGGIYMAGEFTAVGGSARVNIAEVNTTTGAVRAYAPTTMNVCYGFSTWRGLVLSYGETTSVGTLLSLNHPIYKSFLGVLDDTEISGIRRTAFPFKNPRGMWREYRKADGTRQLLGAAEDGLWYTLGDGLYHRLPTKVDGTIPLTKNLGSETDLSTTDQWDFRQMGDYMYMCNGVDGIYAWDGIRVVPWMKGVSPLSIQAWEATANPLPNETYDYCYTYFYGDYETGPSATQTITVSGSSVPHPMQVRISDIPTRHSNCTAIGIYRKLHSEATSLWRLIRKITNDSTTDTVSMSGKYIAGTPSETTDAGSDGLVDSSTFPSMDARTLATLSLNPKYLTSEHSRMFCCGVGDRPYDYFWSELGNPDVIRAASYGRAMSDKGPLIACYQYYGEVHFSKDGRATLILKGDNPNNWAQVETVHPDVGCADHWSVVYRTIPGQSGAKDRYVVCFWGRDGLYEYRGYDFVNVTDSKIQATVESLAVTNSTKADSIWTTETQFRVGGVTGTTANIKNDKNTVDGLRETPGKVTLVNQMDYIGLWGAGNPLVAGKVIAICKGAAEGEFYFSTDGATSYRTIYHTTDNFNTASAVAAVEMAENLTTAYWVIEIIRAVIGNRENLFFATSDVTEKGSIYRLEDPLGVQMDPYLHPALGGEYYWQADTEWGRKAVDSPVLQTLTIGRINADTIVALNGLGNRGATNNIYLTHEQKMFAYGTKMTVGTYNIWDVPGPTTLTDYGSTGSINRLAVPPAGLSLTQFPHSSPAGFHGVIASGSLGNYMGSATMGVVFAHRETALWRGGTFRPQMFYSGGSLYWAGSETAATGWRSSSVYKSNLAATTILKACGYSNVCLLTDGTNIFWTKQTYDTTYGFISNLYYATLATPGTEYVAQPMVGYLPLRISINPNYTLLSLTQVLLAGKKYSADNSYAYTGFVASVVPGNITSFYLFTDSATLFQANALAGEFPLEVAFQKTSPYSFYLASSTGKIYSASSAAAGVAPLFRVAYAGATGILSNLLFVEASGDTNNNTWADRLYLQTSGGTAVFVQLGIPGLWKVIGTYVSEDRGLGVFTSFHNFTVEYTETVEFAIRNHATSAEAATWADQPANKGIVLTTALAHVQWKAVLTWDYTTNPVRPTISSVDIDYFIGVSSVPRILGAHYEGRSYFCVAEAGQTDSNLIVVYNKLNVFDIYKGWGLKSLGLFRGMLVGFEGYNLVQLETGRHDYGDQIIAKEKTGAIVSEPADKRIDMVKAVMETFTNPDAPTTDGYLKVSTYGAGSKKDADWIVKNPVSTDEHSALVNGIPESAANYQRNGWARAMQIEIATSEDTTGSYVPVNGQPERMEELRLDVLVVPAQYEDEVG